MSTRLEAVYENGIFRPLQPVRLAEQQRVTVTIDVPSADGAEAADQVQFALPEERWQAFCDALDAPPKEIPALRKLLTESNLFDGQRDTSIRPVPLTQGHDLTAFDCGAPALNDYLRKYAYQNHQNRSARTYVTLRDSRVIGYYTLAAGSVSREHVPQRVAKGLGNYPVPIILLTRLAVDHSEQGKGLGAALLKDALLRTTQAADIVGCRAVLVHAKDHTAQAFYTKFGFEPSPVDELHLYLLMKDIKASLPKQT